MSYLDVPRIHFGGVFFTDPNTINNVIQLYHDDWSNPPLKQPDGTYTEKLTIDGQPAGRDWNPTGVAQFWFESCQVLSVVGPDGNTFLPDDPDPLTRATIETPSPKTPQQDGPTSYRDLAKMVDLDPDQQGRSELFGLWVYVKLPDGGGFHALYDRPNLRFAFVRPQPDPDKPPFFRGSGGFNNGYIQRIGGTWTAKLINVVWDGGSSPLVQALKKQAPDNTLQLNLSVDIYERDQRLRYGDEGKGNRFGYGRVMGTIGPCKASEPSQIAPARLLDAWRPAPATNAPAIAAQLARTMKTVDFEPTEGVQGSNQPSDWNVAQVLVSKRGTKSFLTINLGMAIPLINAPAPTGGGKMSVGGNIAIGYYDGRAFTALENGTIVIDDSSYQQIAAAVEFKNAYWMTNSGVYEFELTDSEAAKISNLPLGVCDNGTPKLIESTSGLFYDVEPPCIRMEPDSTNVEARLRIYQFGNPVDDLSRVPGFSVTPQVNQWSQQPPPAVMPPYPKDAYWNAQPEPTDQITATIQPAVQPGTFPITVKTGPAVPLPDIRQPLDSQMYFVALDPDVGGESGAAPLSVLFWQNHWVSENPSWETAGSQMGVGDILKAYARLYPGMREKMDIGDEDMVKGAADVILGFMASDFDQPDYMPVVRDMSPSVVNMILNWLSANARNS